MESPFGQPPGKRSAWRLRRPEIYAAAIYGLGVLMALTLAPINSPLSFRTVVRLTSGTAYVLAVMLLSLAPAIASLGAWRIERSNGTAEALVLTTTDRKTLVYARFWSVARPWMWFAVLMLPAYILVFPFEKDVTGTGISLGSSKAVSAALSLNHMGAKLSGPTVALGLIRWVRDLLCILSTAAFGSYLSLRFAGRRGWPLFYVLFPLALATIFCLHDWIGAGMLMAHEYRVDIFVNAHSRAAAYFTLMTGEAIAEALLAFKALGLQISNFDFYMLGEKPLAGDVPAAPPGRER